MKIEVTLEDIKNGKPKNRLYCPIAIALKRKFINKTFRVGSVCLIEDGNRFPSKAYQFPFFITKFILDFDGNRPVKPFSFDFDSLKPFSFV